MSCENQNATGPVNIMPTTVPSNEKSKLTYNFKKDGVSAINKGNYLLIQPSDKSTTSATYVSSDVGSCNNGGKGDYAVDEIRIFNRSLHTYNYKQAAGELIISLNNIGGGRNLIISIPITTKNGTQPKATEQLTTIIKRIQMIGNSAGEGGTIQGLNFDLNKFIPMKKPFYSYTATLPYQPCTACTDYIVYDITNACIYLDHDTLNNLYTNIAPIANNYSTYNKRITICLFKKREQNLVYQQIKNRFI